MFGIPTTLFESRTTVLYAGFKRVIARTPFLAHNLREGTREGTPSHFAASEERSGISLRDSLRRACCRRRERLQDQVRPEELAWLKSCLQPEHRAVESFH